MDHQSFDNQTFQRDLTNFLRERNYEDKVSIQSEGNNRWVILAKNVPGSQQQTGQTQTR